MGGSHQARKLAVNIYKFRSYTAYHWFGMIKSFKHLAAYHRELLSSPADIDSPRKDRHAHDARDPVCG